MRFCFLLKILFSFLLKACFKFKHYRFIKIIIEFLIKIDHFSITQAKPKRKPGALKSKISIAKDFNVALPNDLLDHLKENNANVVGYPFIHLVFSFGGRVKIVNYQAQPFGTPTSRYR